MKRIVFILVLVIVFKGLYAQQKVTGGFPVNITEAPWQVLVSYNGALEWGGGSIIAPNFILTAKHCVAYAPNYLIPFPTSSVKVMAGITCKDEINSGNTFNVSNIILHPDPNVDVALLQLSSNIAYNNSRQPINYWTAVDNTLYNAGNVVRVSGWGWLTPVGNDAANCLQAVDINIITNQQAESMLGKTLYAYEVATAGVGNIRQGACYGDSGGPLTILAVNNEPILIGVVSWGPGDCTGNNTNSPSVYVRVSYIVDWIQTVTCITNFTNQNVTTNKTITSCGDINVQDVKVKNNAKLELDAAGEVNINGDFEVESGSELEIK